MQGTLAPNPGRGKLHDAAFRRRRYRLHGKRRRVRWRTTRLPSFSCKCAARRGAQAYDRHVAAGFVHHNAWFPGDRESLLLAMEKSAAIRAGTRRSEPRQVVDGGDRVAVLSRLARADAGVEIAVVHILRFEGGRIAEMWTSARKSRRIRRTRWGCSRPGTKTPHSRGSVCLTVGAQERLEPPRFYLLVPETSCVSPIPPPGRSRPRILGMAAMLCQRAACTMAA